MGKASGHTPLCVDMDGTLVLGDTLYETLLKVLKYSPLSLLKLPWWLAKGKAYTKRQITRRALIDPSLIPYNQQVLRWLRDEYKRGRTLCLATASDMRLAQSIADHLGIFKHVIASDGSNNLSGEKKMRALVEKFGEKEFAYVGNSKADLAVWAHASEAIIANAKPTLIAQAKRISHVTRSFPYLHKNNPALFLEALRPHKWVKNLLLFVPIITAHQLASYVSLTQAIIGFFAFSATASSIYLTNDLLDVEWDRHHTRKKHRPLASGRMSIGAAVKGSVSMLIVGIAISLLLPQSFLFVITLYIVTSILYTLYLKRTIFLDVLVLASLHVLRILAGSAATGITTSIWLFVFAAFVFTSLAMVKRYSELTNLEYEDKKTVIGRGYSTSDRRSLFITGAISGYISIAVLGFYIKSATIPTLYSHPGYLWLLLPLFLFWITRMWYLAHKGNVFEDPTVFASRDPISYITGIAALVIVFAAT